MARLTAFEFGQIKAHAYHDMGPSAIASVVKKTDGLHPSVQAVADDLAQLQKHPRWRGERALGSGRPRSTPRALDKLLVKEVFRSRGSKKVTVTYLKKKFPRLRRVSDGTVTSRLREAGLAYLRRRRKSLVSKVYKGPRCAFARRVIKAHYRTLARWAYSDGTVFFLDRTVEESDQTHRAALGRYVWRLSDRSDALFSDNVGPSSYKKSQGYPVKIWGLLAHGVLRVVILPKDGHMNRWRYASIIKRYFPLWLNGCDQIVQDFERCLRCEEPLTEMSKLGVTVVPDYPKCSQDLNAIENAWKLLRDRLNETLPTGVERREDFLARLRNAIRWINRNCSDELLRFCHNQKERARDVLFLSGARTQW